MAQKVSLERVAVSLERVEASLERVEASLERLFSAIYCHESYFYTIIFFIKGCQVVKTPMYTGACNLFEVDRGCQKVVRKFYVR